MYCSDDGNACMPYPGASMHCRRRSNGTQLVLHEGGHIDWFRIYFFSGFLSGLRPNHIVPRAHPTDSPKMSPVNFCVQLSLKLRLKLRADVCFRRPVSPPNCGDLFYAFLRFELLQNSGEGSGSTMMGGQSMCCTSFRWQMSR